MTDLAERLKQLDSRVFEDLCFHILKDRFPGANIKKVDGVGGDQGVDIFQGTLSEKLHIWQCKFFVPRFHYSHRAKVEHALHVVLEHFSPEQWTLCIPVDLNTKAHRWFEKLRLEHSGQTVVSLFQGSDMRDELIYRHSIREEFFQDVLKEVLEIKSRVEGEPFDKNPREAAAEAVRAHVRQLEATDSRFHYVATFPAATKFPDLETLRARPHQQGLIASILDEHGQIDVIPRDVEALKLDPPTMSFRLAGEAVKKLTEAMKTGQTVEFGSDEILDVKSGWKLLPDDLRPGKLVLGTPAHLAAERFPCRLRVDAGDESCVFDFVEVGIKRRGTHEVQLCSFGEDLAFELCILSRKEGSGQITWRNRWAQKNVRAVRKALEMTTLLCKGGVLDLFDLKKNRTLTRGRFELSEPVGFDEQDIQGFVDGLVQIADSFGVDLRLGKEMTESDGKTMNFLLTIIRQNGRLTPKSKHVTFHIAKQAAFTDGFVQFADVDRALLLTRDKYYPAPVLFGTEIDTGPCRLFTARAKLVDGAQTKQRYLEADEGELVSITVACVEPLLLVFDRFAQAEAGLSAGPLPD